MVEKNYQVESLRKAALSNDDKRALVHECGPADLSVIRDQKRRNADIGILGFPLVDTSGFRQQSPYESKGNFEDVVHGLKTAILGRGDTVGEKLRASIEGQMTPKEKQQFDHEEQLREQHRAMITDMAIVGGNLSMMPGGLPKAPDMPMHDEISKRIAKTEAKIIGYVRGNMTVADNFRLEKDFGDYERAMGEVRKAPRTVNFAEAVHSQDYPKPSAAMKDYYTRINEATMRYIDEH